MSKDESFNASFLVRFHLLGGGGGLHSPAPRLIPHIVAVNICNLVQNLLQFPSKYAPVRTPLNNGPYYSVIGKCNS